MGHDFRAVMVELGAKIGAEEMAAELGVSLQTVKQARLGPDSPGRRGPPKGWERAAARLAKRQAAYFQRIAETLKEKQD